MLVMIDDEIYVESSKIVRMENIGRDEKTGKIMHRITMTDGSTHDVEPFFVDDILGRDRIVNIVPCPEETWCLYGEKQGDKMVWGKDKVDAYAICADGNIRPINYGTYFSGNAKFLDEDCGFELLVPNREKWDVDHDKELEDYYKTTTEEV